MLQFHEVIEFRFLIGSQLTVLLALNQIGNPLLGFKRWSKACDRLRRR